MSHEPRLTRELRTLLHTQRMAALGTLTDEGAPFVSMVTSPTWVSSVGARLCKTILWTHPKS